MVLISSEEVAVVAPDTGAAASVRKQDLCPDTLRRLWETHRIT